MVALYTHHSSWPVHAQLGLGLEVTAHLGLGLDKGRVGVVGGS